MDDKQKNQINKWIHEQVMGLCWGVGRDFSTDKCENCGATAYEHDLPDYTSPGSPRRLLQEVLVKVFADIGSREVTDRVEKMLNTSVINCAIGMRLTAEQIATACFLATGGKLD